MLILYHTVDLAPVTGGVHFHGIGIAGERCGLAEGGCTLILKVPGIG